MSEHKADQNATRPYRLKVGKKYQVGGQRIEPGTIVQLTPSQAKAFADSFDAVDVPGSEEPAQPQHPTSAIPPIVPTPTPPTVATPATDEVKVEHVEHVDHTEVSRETKADEKADDKATHPEDHMKSTKKGGGQGSHGR